jgi:ataxin-3
MNFLTYIKSPNISILSIKLIFSDKNLFKIRISMLPAVQEKVYWEKQGQDKLCGVHCVNSLLQGPFFDEITLSEIALELDSKEKQLMAARGFDSQDFLKFMAQESNNVADDGNYSFQVLSEALSRTFNLEMESVDSKIWIYL